MEVNVKKQPHYWSDLGKSYKYFFLIVLESIWKLLEGICETIGTMFILIILPLMELWRYIKVKPYFIKRHFLRNLRKFKTINDLENAKLRLNHWKSDPLYEWGINQINEKITKLQTIMKVK